MGDRYFAVVDPRSPRHATWMDMFGQDFVEVEDARAHAATLDSGLACDFYMAKVASLTDLQLGRVIRVLASRTHRPFLEVAIEVMEGPGIPVLADEVRIFKDPIAGRLFFDRSEA